MVRKINKKVKKAKPEFRFMPTAEQIDEKIDNFIEHIRPLVGEEKADCFNEMVKDNSNLSFMPRAMAIIRAYNRVVAQNEFDDECDVEIAKAINDLLDEYKEKYIPKMSTIFYINLFAINKVISRYFKVNLYRKRFSVRNNNKLYLSDTYKKINSMIKNRPIQADKERVFEGVWNEKVIELSKMLDKILHRLDKYRETFIIPERVINEYERVKSTLQLEFSETKPLTKSEIKYIKRLFGETDLAKEVIKARGDSCTDFYKSEYNVIIDVYLYISLIEAKTNFDELIKELSIVTGNRFLAEDVAAQVKQVTDFIGVFIKNFDNLVCEGTDTFDNNIKNIIVTENKGTICAIGKKGSDAKCKK